VSAEQRPIAAAVPSAPENTAPAHPVNVGERFFLVFAILIGVLAGCAVVCFRISIEWSRRLLLGSGAVPNHFRMVAAPALVSLVIAFLVIKFFPRARGSGVNQTKSALYIYDGYIPMRTAIGKFITSALAIGAGHSLGPEDPSLQIGAGIASAIGRRLRLSREKLRLVAPIGAAAGLAAAFNAPISAVLFVIEEVVGRWSVGVLGAIVLAAVSSVTVTRSLLGAEPLFRIPPIEVTRPSELLAYSVLGVAGGVASLVFAKAIGYLRPRLKAMPHWTQYFQPAIAGFLIGLIGWLGAPQVMGAGYDIIDQAMHDQFPWKFLAILAGVKLLATTLSFVSGTPGGMFAPTLFIGAMLGGAVGGVEQLLFPHMHTSVGAYALVGMGVLFAGFLRAPLTSVFMVLEVSGDYSIILPVIVANTIAYLISRATQPVPIFDLLTQQDGLQLPSMEERREEAVLRVEDAMRRPGVPVLDDSESVDEAINHVVAAGDAPILVRLSPSGWSCTSLEKLRAAREQGDGDAALREVFSLVPLPHVHADQPLETALRRAYGWPLLPVVHRADFRLLVGVISFEDILSKYRESASSDEEPPLESV
jgi:CIC family chloride channel protein